MKTKPELEAADVKKIAAAAEAEALKNQWAVTIAIVDDGGHLLSLQRLDGAAPVSSHIAPGRPARPHWGAVKARSTKTSSTGAHGLPERSIHRRPAGRRRADHEGRSVPGRSGRERREIDGRRADRQGGHSRIGPLNRPSSGCRANAVSGITRGRRRIRMAHETGPRAGFVLGGVKKAWLRGQPVGWQIRPFRH